MLGHAGNADGQIMTINASTSRWIRLQSDEEDDKMLGHEFIRERRTPRRRLLAASSGSGGGEGRWRKGPAAVEV